MKEQDRTGMRSRGRRGRFGLSSGDLPSSSGSAGETVVVDGVNVFLDLEAVVLWIMRERSAVGVATRSGAIGFPASRTRLAYLYTP
jgi:hypothetical protein